MSARDPFKRGNALDWTPERIGALTAAEIKHLRDNARRLDELQVVQLCEAALQGSRAGKGTGIRQSKASTQARRLIARANALEARGAMLQDRRTSWGGVRKSDGKVVMALWAEAIETADGACRYLLWAPNTGGSRPWSDKAAGQERLEHCKLAHRMGSAEGVLVYGHRLATHLPEDKARAIHGADAETVLTFAIEQVGDEFWATWGKKAAASAIERL